jgi:hypothetical protein
MIKERAVTFQLSTAGMCLIEFPQQHGGSDTAMNCPLYLEPVIISVNELTLLEDMKFQAELTKSVICFTDSKSYKSYLVKVIFK